MIRFTPQFNDGLRHPAIKAGVTESIATAASDRDAESAAASSTTGQSLHGFNASTGRSVDQNLHADDIARTTGHEKPDRCLVTVGPENFNVVAVTNRLSMRFAHTAAARLVVEAATPACLGQNRYGQKRKPDRDQQSKKSPYAVDGPGSQDPERPWRWNVDNRRLGAHPNFDLSPILTAGIQCLLRVEACDNAETPQPPIDPPPQSRWHLLEQGPQFMGSEPMHLPDINTPKRFGLPDQPRPGAAHLPTLKTLTQMIGLLGTEAGAIACHHPPDVFVSDWRAIGPFDRTNQPASAIERDVEQRCRCWGIDVGARIRLPRPSQGRRSPPVERGRATPQPRAH